MFINDLPKNIESGCLLYADDVKKNRKITSPADGQSLQRDLSRLSAWSVSWGLTLNPTKCKSFTMTLRRAPVQTKYFIAGTELEHVVVVGPPGRCATGAKPRLRRAIAPEGLHVAGEGCGQGRDDVRVSHRLWRRVA